MHFRNASDGHIPQNDCLWRYRKLAAQILMHCCCCCCFLTNAVDVSRRRQTGGCR